MKKTMKKTKKKVVKGSAPEYRVTVKIMGKSYVAGGSSVSEALLGLKPENCKGKAILTVQHGEVTKERVLMPVVAFRLFNTRGLANEVALKQASLLFQGL